MPAAVAKGIIISVSIIAALSIAVLENPQVQSWLEEQRRKIAELLRSVGQDLDPESRRKAEAFAFEGRNPANDQEPQREASKDQDTIAKATGSCLSDTSTIRRIPVKGPANSIDAEERRRKGREYLAKRNQQMIELQERRKLSKSEMLTSPPTPTSFDAMVDTDGNLKDTLMNEKDLPSPPVTQPIPEQIQEEMREVERQLHTPMLVGHSGSTSADAWHMGTEAANPFGDEYALERSITPRPVPPREERTSRTASPEPTIPGSFAQQPQLTAGRDDDVDAELTYEEQLAIAMSLSEQENAANAATIKQRTADEDADIRRAIRASLKDLDVQQAAHAVAHAETSPRDSQPLVDLTPASPLADALYRNEWESVFNRRSVNVQGITSHFPPRAPPSETTDELYCITPELTHARLATFDAQQNASIADSVVQTHPVNQAQGVVEQARSVPDALEASFFSAPSVISQRQSSHTLDDETPRLIDVDEDVHQEGAQTPRSSGFSSTGFRSELDSETIGSASAPISRSGSRVQSEISAAELVELLEDDSDVDMLSEEGDGIATPDSWSEVGSRDAESETGETPRPREAAW